MPEASDATDRTDHRHGSRIIATDYTDHTDQMTHTEDQSGRRAVVLLSGGLDSFTAAAMTKAEGYELYALSIRYGQIHAREIEAARAAARALGVARHLELGGRPRGVRRLGPRRRRHDPEGSRARERSQHPVDLRARAQHCLSLAGARLGRSRRRHRHRHRRERARLFGLSRLPARVSRSLRAHGRARHQGRRRRPAAADPRAAPALVEGRHHSTRPRARARLRRHPQLLRPGAVWRALRPLRQLPPASEGIRRGRRRRPGASGDSS